MLREKTSYSAIDTITYFVLTEKSDHNGFANGSNREKAVTKASLVAASSASVATHFLKQKKIEARDKYKRHILVMWRDRRKYGYEKAALYRYYPIYRFAVFLY